MRAAVMRSQLLVACFAASPVTAFLTFRGLLKGSEKEATWLPQETGTSTVDEAGWSPRPTSSPGHGPDLAEFELFKRFSGYTMGTDTCGFVATDWSNAFTCLKLGASCTNDGAFLGCCTNTGRDCYSTIKTACIGYAASLTGACDSLTGHNTACCSKSASQFCHTYTFETTASPGLTLSLINCDRSTGTDLLLDYPPIFTRTRTSSTNSTPSSTGITTDTTDTSTPTPSDTNTPDPSGTPEPTSSTAGDDDDGTTTPTPSKRSNAGAIAGGVVGGIAGLSLIVIAIVYFLRRRKSGSAAAAAPETSQVPPPGHGPSSPGTHSNTHYSQSYPNSAGYPSPQSSPYAPGVAPYGHPSPPPGAWDASQSPPPQGFYGDVPKDAGIQGVGYGAPLPQHQYAYAQELPAESPHADPVEMPAQPHH